MSTPNSAATPIKAPSTAIISNRSRSRSLSRRSNTSPQDCRQRTRIRLSAFRPDGAEPLCLFLVTSASWRLRGVKTPPKQRSNGEQPQGALASERRGSLFERLTRRSRVSLAKTRTPPGSPRAGSREPSWCGRYEGLCCEGSASQTHGRAKGSSRNVVVFIDSTPRADAGCPRSLARPAAR